MARRGPRHGGGGGGGGFRQDGPHNGGNAGGHSAHNQTSIPPPQQTQIVTEEHPPVEGPYPGFVTVASQYTLEHQLRQMQRETGCDPAREDSYRLQGVQLIDSVREALRLPVKTFTTACTYYHKFRLNFRDAEYNFQDAALAALFVACKVEDTIKKARDVLCAAYNLKNPDKPTTPDDKIFERPASVIVGLDRLILQTVGFDFRVRHPQKLLIKLIRKLAPEALGRDVLQVAYPMSIDMYKTFAPIKQTSFAMAIAVIELSARVLCNEELLFRLPHFMTMPDDQTTTGGYHTNRGCVVETLLDLLDLYTQFPKSTKIGSRFSLGTFIDIKIKINQEVDDDPGLSRTDSACEKCCLEEGHAHNGTLLTPGSAASPATTGSNTGAGASAPAPGKLSQKKAEGTMRFLFDAEKMRQEQAEVAEYFKEEYTEEVVEVDEPIPEPVRSGGGGGSGGKHNQHGNRNQNPNNSHNQHHGPTRRERNGGNGDNGWGPYPRSRNNDRHKSRKGGAGHY